MASIPRVQLGGLLVSLSGFAITRLFVAQTIAIDTSLTFVLVGLLPLVVGLALSIYGVVLALGPFTSEYVRTVASWHLLGLGTMVAVFGITSLEQLLRLGSVELGYDAPLLVANVLLGGAVGGTVTGVRSAQVQRQKGEIKRSANRALLVTRLLKHEVLNAITIIDGHANLLDESNEGRPSSLSAIRTSVTQIERTIKEVGTITGGPTNERVDAAAILRRESEALEATEDADLTLSIESTETEVVGDDRFGIVVRELLENAIVHGEGAVEATLRDGPGPHSLVFSVVDEGPGLSADQRALLEDGEFPEFDDPTAGFGLQIVRLLVVQFDGDIEVQTVGDDEGTEITLRLPRTEKQEVTAESIGVTLPNLTVAMVGGAAGGLAMGLFYQFFTGLLPVIGSLYGVENPVIGWVTHLFHSAVFGLVFVGLVAGTDLGRLATGPLRSGAFGVAWGSLLWLVAAGFVMPTWLVLTGTPTPIPNLTTLGFVGHAIWGAVLGVSYFELAERYGTAFS